MSAKPAYRPTNGSICGNRLPMSGCRVIHVCSLGADHGGHHCCNASDPDGCRLEWDGGIPEGQWSRGMPRNMPTPSGDEMQAGPKLNAMVAEKVFGLPVVGTATCVYVEGEWSIHVDSDPKGWACHAEAGPVCVEHCVCEYGPIKLDPDSASRRAARRRTRGEDANEAEIIARYNAEREAEWAADKLRFGGHSRECLRVVESYSESIAAALQVVDHTVATRDWRWQIGVVRGLSHVTVHALGETLAMVTAPTLPLALCRAALTALGGLNNG